MGLLRRLRLVHRFRCVLADDRILFLWICGKPTCTECMATRDSYLGRGEGEVR